jgi:GDP-L-fucose synthase
MINLREKKILVTGGSGFIGKKVVDNLIKKRGVLPNKIFIPLEKDCDLRRWEDCQRAVKGMDIVIHLAAVTGNIEFHKLNPGKIFYDNLIMGTYLMEASRLAGVEKFLGIGSATEYPKDAPIPLKEKDLWQGYPEEMNAPYSLAKKMLLVQGQAYRQQYGFNAIHLLLTNVFGPEMNLENGYVISSLIQKIEGASKRNEKFIELWGTGKPTRDFLYIEDAAEAIVLAVENYDKAEPVNIGSGQEISIRELATLMDFNGEIRWDKSKPDGQLRRFLDTSLAKKEFGFEAKTKLKEGLTETLKWYKNEKK